LVAQWHVELLSEVAQALKLHRSRVDVTSFGPSTATIVRSARKTGKCLVVYEDNPTYGAGAEIAAIIADEAFDAVWMLLSCASGA